MPEDSNKINKAIPIDAYGKCHITEPVMAKSDNDDDDDEHQDEQQDKKNLNHKCLNVKVHYKRRGPGHE